MELHTTLCYFGFMSPSPKTDTPSQIKFRTDGNIEVFLLRLISTVRA